MFDAALDYQKTNPGKKVAILTMDRTEIWQDGKMLEVLPREIDFLPQGTSDVVFAEKGISLIQSETLHFPPHEPRMGLSKFPWWPTPPKDEL